MRRGLSLVASGRLLHNRGTVIWEFTLFILKMYCSNIYFNIYTVLLLCCCIRRAYVYLDVKSSSQMTNRFKYDLLCCQ